MEVEYLLGNFFTHNHSIYDVDMICCWQISHAHLANEINKYMQLNTEIKDIKLIENDNILQCTL